MSSHDISIKSATDVEVMRVAGKLLADVFHMLDDYIKPGISTMQINDRVGLYRQRA